MRRRYVWDATTKSLVEVTAPRAAPVAPAVFGDLPAYTSPIDGKLIDGKRDRRNDLARSQCRPYEGREQEAREAQKVHIEQDRKLDQLAEKIAHRAWAEAPERIRKVFRGR
jgi:hypothetical protein